MTKNVILMIGREPGSTDDLVRDLEWTCQIRVQTIEKIGDAIALGGLDGFAVILVWSDGSGDCEELIVLLSSLSTTKRTAPVVVLSAFYDEGEAMTCFRMGVTDYLSLHDHREVVPTIVEKLIAGRFDAPEIQTSEPPLRGWNFALSRAALKRS